MTQDMNQNMMNDKEQRIERLGNRFMTSCAKEMHALRYVLVVVLMIIGGGVNSAWGQTVSSGLYYIASGGNDGTVNQFVYNSNTPETNFYLCPTENWRYFKSESPYYQESDNGMPFMTTYQCLNDNNYDSKNALWCIKKKEDTDYYLLHNFDHSDGRPGCLYVQKS